MVQAGKLSLVRKNVATHISKESSTHMKRDPQKRPIFKFNIFFRTEKYAHTAGQ